MIDERVIEIKLDLFTKILMLTVQSLKPWLYLGAALVFVSLMLHINQKQRRGRPIFKRSRGKQGKASKLNPRKRKDWRFRSWARPNY